MNPSERKADRLIELELLLLAHPEGLSQAELARLNRLRHEVRLRKGWRIGKSLDVTHPLLMDVTPERLGAVLKRDLEILGLDQELLGEEEAYVQLCETHGQKRGNELNDVLLFLKRHPDLSKNQLAFLRRISKRTLDYQLQQMSQAGVYPTCQEKLRVLAPLSIPLDDLSKQLLKVTGDTTLCDGISR